METLAERLALRDARQFVGRARELTFFDSVLVADPPSNVVLVHGPGGIGKSALLREVSRRGRARGFTPRLVEGRDLAPAPGELERILDGVERETRPLVLFDTYERIAAIGGWLRERLLPSLPSEAVVVIAGRRRPEADWLQGGWEQVVAELELEPFDEADARRLATSHGLRDEAAVARLIEWAGGSPLALSVGAAAGRDGLWRPEWLEGRPDLLQAILRRLGDAELDTADRDVLAVAALARAVDARMLRDVLPAIDADEAEAWLRTRTFVEPVGIGVAPHELVRKALRADLRARPEQERALRRRIADHLHARAAAGQSRLVTDLAELVQSPTLRWGLGAEGSVRFRVDGFDARDVEVLGEAVRARFAPDQDAPGGWWAATERLVRAAPERALLVRDADESVCGFAYAVTALGAPAAAEEDPVLAPWLAHARARAPSGSALVWRDSIDFLAPREGDLASPVLALLNTGLVLRSGLSNPRLSYLPIAPDNEAAVAFARAMSARHEPELDVVFSDGQIVQCWILDHGDGGLLGGILGLVYAESGATLPPSGANGNDATHDRAITASDVRDALRSLDHPLELAASPLAVGATPEERVASVRAALRRAADEAFGETAEERLLRAVLQRGYLDHAGGHQAVWWDLHMSRATYFRKLRAASERVADWLLARDREPSPGRGSAGH